MQTEANLKLARVRGYLAEKGYTGAVLLRQDSFAWITSGGLNRVVIPSAEGVAAVVVTPEAAYLVAQVMDGGRIMDEELNGLTLEYVPLGWYEETVLERALSLAGERPVADVPCPGDFQLEELYELHFPYTTEDIGRFFEAGALVDEVLTKVAWELRPGMAEREAEAMLLYEFTRRGAICDVALVGSDQRVFQYRHPTPTDAALDRYVLLTPAVRYKGVHCNVARSVYFGDALPHELQRAYEAVRTVSANCMALCRTGVRYAEILEEHKALLAELGLEGQWRGHYPGGRTGYFLCQASLSLDPARAVGETEAFEWFITVPGAKTAELTVKNGDQVRVASGTGLWPSSGVARHGLSFPIPEILLR